MTDRPTPERLDSLAFKLDDIAERFTPDRHVQSWLRSVATELRGKKA